MLTVYYSIQLIERFYDPLAGEIYVSGFLLCSIILGSDCF